MGASASYVAPRRGPARERRPLLAGRLRWPVRPAAFVVRAAAGRSGARWTRPPGARLRRRGACSVGACAGRPWAPGLTGAAPGARASRARAPGRGPSRSPAPGLAGARTPAPAPASAPGATRAPARCAPGSGVLRGSSGRPSSGRGLPAALRPPGGTTPRRRLSPSVAASGSAAGGTRRTSRTARPRRRGATVRLRGVLRHQVIVGVVSRRPECRQDDDPIPGTAAIRPGGGRKNGRIAADPRVFGGSVP